MVRVSILLNYFLKGGLGKTRWVSYVGGSLSMCYFSYVCSVNCKVVCCKVL